MVEIIPAILAQAEDKFFLQEAQIDSGVRTLHIDVMDGVFVPHTTWISPADLEKLGGKYFLEIHLMVKNPLSVVGAWIEHGADRVIVHAEAEGWKEALAAIRTEQMEAGVAINPGTTIDVLKGMRGSLDTVLLMGVEPGASGQEFQEKVFEKIQAVHELYPSLPIQVDGGVRVANAKRMCEAGAEALVASSALFAERNFPRAYEAMTNAVK